jgi:hypothetical protein
MIGMTWKAHELRMYVANDRPKDSKALSACGQIYNGKELSKSSINQLTDGYSYSAA